MSLDRCRNDTQRAWRRLRMDALVLELCAPGGQCSDLYSQAKVSAAARDLLLHALRLRIRDLSA